MVQLTTLSANASNDEILSAVHKDGAVIVKDMLDAGVRKELIGELRPYMDATRFGQDAFTGFKTTRTGALVARSPACRELVLNPKVLEATRAFLEPYCARVQLHLAQIIRLSPGQPQQMIHRDRWAWGKYLQGVEPQFNTIWALSDFTRENGATQVVPGSISWPDDREAKPEEVCQAEMAAGSVLLYTGSVFHGGGENRSADDRIGLNITYSLGWLRQEENQYLSCPPEIARELPPELQDLLGYTLGSYALGYYTPPLPPGEGPEVVGPEYALGRKISGEGIGSAELLDAVTAADAQRG
jgi:ectoine hydroxylase-related dioxygenase (phytanoyl-CoA dioxygenase family)